MKRVVIAAILLGAAVYLAACAVDEAGLPRNNLTGANDGKESECVGGLGVAGDAGVAGATVPRDLGSSAGGRGGDGDGNDAGKSDGVPTGGEARLCLMEGLKAGWAFSVTSCGGGRALCKVRDDVGSLTPVVGCNPIPGFTCVPGAC